MLMGCDPEFFLLSPDGRRTIPAHNFFPPSARKMAVRSPMVAMDPEGREIFSFFRDGYAMELNHSPRDCRQLLTMGVQEALRVAETFVLRGDAKLTTAPMAVVDWKAMKGAPGDVLEVGCAPSRDAYNGDVKVPSLDPRTSLVRFAGGHMHFSETPNQTWNNKESVPQSVKWLDLYVGLPLTYLFPSEGAFMRRQYYGQAGEFRFGEWPAKAGQFAASGLEYRVPGPEMWRHVAIVSLAYGAARYTLQHIVGFQKWDARIEEPLKRAINTGEGMEEMLPSLTGYYTPDTLRGLREKTLAMKETDLLVGLTQVGEGYLDFLKQWKLEPNAPVRLPKAA